MAETWRPIPGYEGAYEVSDHGRVRSIARLDSRGRDHMRRKRAATTSKTKAA